MFSKIQLRSNWRQFNKVNITFDKKMTVLTGENGTGKTTILNILSNHFGWNLPFISTLQPMSQASRKRIWSDWYEKYSSDFDVKPNDIEVGSIIYKNKQRCLLMVPPKSDKAQYPLKYSGKQAVDGLYIPSHQPVFTYNQVSDIPTDPKTSQQQYQSYLSLLLQLYQASPTQNPGLELKRSLMALGTFGYTTPAVMGDSEYKRTWEEFQDILRILMPSVIGFEKLEIRAPDIIFLTKSGNWPLGAASGGIGALVGIAWQIFMYGQDKDEFIVTIDEPESHLHPSMQREVLSNLIRAFPKTQFIVATHSPSIVTSFKKARVYALMFNESHRVDSIHLKEAELSGTANETLREILGVHVTIPIWVEVELNRLVKKYSTLEITGESINQMRNELNALGLSGLVPEAIINLVDKNND